VEWDSVVEEVVGESLVESLVVRNVKTGARNDLAVDGVFVYVGQRPNTAYLGDALKLDERGYIIANEEMETSAPGVFAAGDVRAKTLRQVVTACADGAMAAVNADKFLQEQVHSS
jgi:thioredoxin reductase (NADPH)